MASQVASLLRGKHKPTFTPHMDAGDFVIVINAAKVKLTGKKLDDKMYRTPLRHPGRLQGAQLSLDARQSPEARARDRGDRHAAQGPLGRNVAGKLKVTQARLTRMRRNSPSAPR